MARRRISRIAALAALLGTTLVAAAARADEPSEPMRAVRVRYEVPDGCPSRTWLEGTLHFRSSRIVAVGTDEDGEYDADVSVVTAKDGFRGSLRIAPRGGAQTTREIEGARCQTVVDALGFTIALLLDPEGINSGTLPSDVELTRLAESARSKQAAPPQSPPTPPPPVVVSPAPDRSPRPSPATTRLSLLADLGGGAWTGVRGMAPRGHFGVEARWQRQTLSPFARLGGFLEPAAEATAAPGTISYLPTGGRLDLGALVRVGSTFRLGGGVHLTTLVMPVDAPSADERRPSLRIVPSAGPALRAAWEPSRIGLALEASGGAHFVRERFRIEAPGTTGEVFRLPGIYVQATIGLVVRFVDLKTPFGT